MRIAGTTDMGFKRSDNQDRYMAGELSNGCAFAFVCDGMGGANGGSVASEKLAKYLEECLFMQGNNMSMDEEKTIMDAIDEANRAIFIQAENDEELKGMGTTISGLTIKNGLCKVYNAGDSRVYVLRQGELTQVTEDHSVVQELYRQGKLNREQIADHPQKNLITRAVGVMESVDIDVSELSLKKGDRLLCASDGLTNFVSEGEIKEILSHKEIFEIPKQLIDKALENKSSDNITAVVLEY